MFFFCFSNPEGSSSSFHEGPSDGKMGDSSGSGTAPIDDHVPIEGDIILPPGEPGSNPEGDWQFDQYAKVPGLWKYFFENFMPRNFYILKFKTILMGFRIFLNLSLLCSPDPENL